MDTRAFSFLVVKSELKVIVSLNRPFTQCEGCDLLVRKEVA